jgi:hypothetical protein
MSACAFCYSKTASFSCGKCKKRSYCSKECQTEDWKKGCHKHWCGIAGELGYDFEIKDTGVEGKGLGVYALRDFKRNDKIMAERPAMRSEDDPDVINNPSVYDAVMLLEPLDVPNIQAKFKVNSMRCSCVGPDKHGLFLNLSRANHHCSGNSHHNYIEKHDLKILVATTNIAAGEEITFPYTDSTPDSHETIFETWGFHCVCSGCQNPARGTMHQELRDLDELIGTQCSANQIDEAIHSAKRMIVLFNILSVIPSGNYARTYNDLLSLCVMRRATLDDAKLYARLAYEAEAATYSGCLDQKVGSLSTNKRFVEDITCHPNYLIMN